MARVNKTHVVEDPFDDELNDVENFESTGAGGRGKGGSMPPPSYAELSSFFGLWSISLNHAARTKQETFCVRRGCRLSETLRLNQRGMQTSWNLRRPNAYTVQ